MNIPPKEFKVRLSIENNCFRVDFEEGGEVSAIVSEPMTGDFLKDQDATRNLRDIVVHTMLERFYPALVPPYKSVHAGEVGLQQSIVDPEELERRKAEHRANFLEDRGHDTARTQS